ncbi:RidA family protein [Campylobacter sp. US33a]|uniref:RidA family protein n=1 Tax=Campylobacter sp. CCS1377 TaxID=3158229 RepID=A0AAU7E9H5_9BACT|nr:RidA family protein [Campylobacter sp. US33a]MCW1359695.1 RidA family protein [Campylobacter jejuni]TEY04516.1 RidA family protein [Campylobacter sp. US33a]
MTNYPKAIGPYSAYREANGMLFISGQLPINPTSGEIESLDIKEQTRQSLKNIGAILEENGISYDKVVKTTCFLAEISDFLAFNEVYAEFFKAPYPARSAFAVKDLPKGAKIEIEVIASKG